MRKAKTETRPHSERSKGLSRTSPGNSVQASSTASHSLVSTRVQANGSGAVLSPSSVAISQAFSSQGMPFKSVLPPHFLETLVAKVADEVSHRFSTVLPAQTTTPASSQLTEVAVCMLIFKHLDVHLCLTFHQWTRPYQFPRFSWGRGFIRGSAVWPTQQTHW